MSRSPETQHAILFLAANPDGLRRVGQELREIKEGLKRSKERDRFSLTPCLDVRPRDIQRALLDESPHIIHFAGRGVGEEGLVFEDERGNPRLVDGAALAGLFALFADQIQCVVLNGCYSEVQAQAIAQHIEYVIGIRDEISNEAALEFAIGFYDALGAGRPIEFAHRLGCSAIQMQGLADHLAPVLVQKAKPGPVDDSGEAAMERSGRLWQVPELPPHFLPRLELQSLKAQVLSGVQQPIVMTGGTQRIGVQGMGGIGKSVLAAALAREPEVQQAFPDGIFWVTVGIEPLLVMQQADLAAALSGEKPAFNEVKQGKECLGQLLADRDCLLILDDVWQLDHADAFNVISPPSRLMMTTRDGELITGLGAISYRLDVLSDEQSLHLLAAWAGFDVMNLPATAKVVAQECGNLPLALSLCGAMVRDLTPWKDVLEALREADLGFIQKQFAHYPYPDVFKALHISVEVLARTNPIAAERYRELAVFPVDESIPEGTVVQFWQYTGVLKARAARQILTTLSSKGLLRLDGELPNRRVSLHDLQQDYLRSQQSDRQSLHGQLLAAYQQDCPQGWHQGANDGYFFEHLAYHLFAAGQPTQLQALLFDFRWIQAKLTATDINALLSDYEWLPHDAELRLVQGALRLSAHILIQDKHQLQSQLYGRLLKQPASQLQDLVQQAAQFRKSPWLRCLVPSLVPPGGSLVRTFSGHPAPVLGVAISPDGHYLFSTSGDCTVKMWEVDSGKELRTFNQHKGYVRGAAVSPDDRHVFASFNNTVKMWEVESGKELRTFTGHTAAVSAVAVSSDSRYVLSASSDRTVKVWEVESGKEFHTLTGHTFEVTGVAISPDGRYVFSASRDCTVKMWEVESGKELHTLTGHTAGVSAVTVSPDSRYVFSASSDRTVKMWEVESGKEFHTLTGHAESVLGVAVSPNGRYVFTASFDNTVKVWEVESGKELHTLTGHTAGVTGVTVSPNGRYVFSASFDDTVKVWEMNSGEALYPFTGHTADVTGVAVSPDSRYALSGSWDGTVKVWELDSGKELHLLAGHAGYVFGATISPDSRYILSASADCTVKIWELASGKELRTLTGHTGGVIGVAMSPDGRYILSASADHTVKIWELSSGKELRTLTGHTESVSSIAMSPDGRYVLSASADRTVKIWELASGKELRTLTGHTESVSGIATSPDSRYVLSASADCTVRIWELTSGKELHTFTRHIGHVFGVTVSPDGRYVLSVSADCTVKVWELTNGKEVTSFTGNGGLRCCAIALDGVTIIVGESGGQIHFLRLEGVESGIEE